MQRVLEPEYMDTPEEANGYAAMDHSVVNAAVVDRFLALGGGTCTRVVDLGCGPGDIPFLLLQRSAIRELVGVDAAATMLALARPKAKALGLEAHADGAFDGVLSNTILHHIPEPVDFLREAARVLRPGGVLLIRDLFRPASLDDARRLVALHASGASPDQQQLLLQSLCAALTVDEARAACKLAGLSRARVEANSDRHYSIEIAR